MVLLSPSTKILGQHLQIATISFHLNGMKFGLLTVSFNKPFSLIRNVRFITSAYVQLCVRVQLVATRYENKINVYNHIIKITMWSPRQKHHGAKGR